MLRSHPTNILKILNNDSKVDDYLPYLPAPLNQCLGDDLLFVTLKTCVPAWQKKYTDSNTRKNIDNINDLSDYYGDLENQKKNECNQDNQHEKKETLVKHRTAVNREIVLSAATKIITLNIIWKL
jgi:hypothetical protein